MNKRSVSELAAVVLGMVAVALAVHRTVNAQPQTGTTVGGVATADAPLRLRSVTNQQRRDAAVKAAAARAAAKPAVPVVARATRAMGAPAPTVKPMPVLVPGGTPNYFGPEGNWAYSPAPAVDPLTGAVTGGIPKFVDTLPGLTAANANNRGIYISVATPDKGAYPGSDYYELGLRDYSTHKFHSTLPATPLRGYRQINTADATVNVNTCLGPLIIAQKDVPVRIKFVNELGTGDAGNLPIPVDTSVMGAGMGPDGMNAFPQNRANLHLHGGNTPWISDGTAHQWVTPAGESSTIYTKGVSFQNVPDMVGPGKAAPNPTATDGIGTYYYPNQQSARLMFYHDHSWGITRLNVYAGEAAGYLLTDQVEEDLISGTNVSGVFGAGPGAAVLPDLGGVYHNGIPLIIQDKTIVDAGTISATDPTWNWGSTPGTPRTGDLWLPHVYMPSQNPNGNMGTNPVGRWDYGPWFWPPVTTAAGLIHGEVVDPDTGVRTPGTPNPSLTPEAFMDTPVVNGCAYPALPVDRKAYRFRILNACNDRSMNLQLYYADTGGGGSGATATATITGVVNTVTIDTGGAGYTSAPAVAFNGGGASTPATAVATVAGGQVVAITITSPGDGYTSAPTVVFTGGGASTPASATATITNVVNAVNITAPGAGYTSGPGVYFIGGGGSGAAATTAAAGGGISGATVTYGGSGYTSAPIVKIGDTGEVKMVAAVPTSGWPATWPTDGRAGGVPDPTTAGPTMIQIGTEGGFLPKPVVHQNTPIGYEYNRRNIVVLNVTNKTLMLGPAERADVIVDFSQVPASAGVTNIILYNDAPAPMPAFDTRYDLYTGDPDQSATGDPARGGQTGGAPATVPGYGPNTRTIMQFQVAPGSPTATAFDLPSLQAALPLAFAKSQDAPVVPQTTYPAPNTTSVDTYAKIQDAELVFPSPVAAPVAKLALTSGGSGYTSAPSVTITGSAGAGATATATVTYLISSLTLTNPGTGYTSPPAVVITGGGGTGARATASIDGVVNGIAVTAGGGGYSSPPTVVITGTGTGASATATIQGPVGTVSLLTGGSGYTSTPTVSFSGGGGTGASATAVVLGVVGAVNVSNGGTGYTSAPAVSFSGGGGAGAAATATIAGGRVIAVAVTNPGAGYTGTPTVRFSGGGGANARASATIARSVTGVALTNAGKNYTSPPAVVFSGGGATVQATASTTLYASVAVVTLTAGGRGYVAPPTVSFVGGGGSGAAAASTTATGVNALTLTNPGRGYTSVPTVTLTGGGGSGATAAAIVTGAVTGLKLTNAGDGYTSPTVAFSGGGGSGAAATATTSTTMPMVRKAIQELFELNYGRMNSTLGAELPMTNFATQTTIPLGFIDPPTELLKDGQTQIWKITHNGVDTHAIHFHLFDVQIVNRVGWDGMIREPDPNELGWKETVRMNPLEDCIVAFRAAKQNLPWPIPDSVRLLDPSMPQGSTAGFTGVDPATNNPITVINQPLNFGWEYVWHCHLLGHEENDMMRPMSLQVNPDPPVLTGVLTASAQVDLAWTGKALNVTGFQVYRAPISAGVIGSYQPLGAPLGPNVTTYADTGVGVGNAYAYYVVANNGNNGWYKSSPSNVVTARMGPPPAPTGLTATPSPLALSSPTITLAWTNTDPATTGTVLQRSTSTGFPAASLVTFPTMPAATTSFTDTTVANTPTTYYYRVAGTNTLGNSPWSNRATGQDPGQLPAAPTALTLVTATRTSVSFSWAGILTAGPVTGFRLQRSAAGPTGPWTNIGTTPGTTFTDGRRARNTQYWYQVQAYNAAGNSTFSNVLPATTLP